MTSPNIGVSASEPSPHRRIAASPCRRIAASPHRRVAASPCRSGASPYQACRPFALSAIGYSEIPIVLDVALADDFPSAVNEIELAELFVLVFQVDCPIPASGGSGIGTPG